MPDSESHAPLGLSEADTRTIDERARHCFGCGPENPEGLHLSFTVESNDAEITSTARVNLTHLHEGPPGYIHGGIIATLMDEAMSKLNRPLKVIAMTRNLNVDYLRPCPLNTDLTLIGRHLQRDGRKLHHEAELRHPDGTILARAKGFFIAIDPEILAAAMKSM